jgi:hypothetical protein
MESRPLKPFLIVLVILSVTSLALAYTVNVRITDEAGIKLVLPDRIDNWRGEELRFCQNPACQREWALDTLERPDACPACAGVLASMSFAERSLLPADTLMLKKRYINPAGEVIHVSIVLSGKERASIHRPQVCLRGQGRTILREFPMEIPLRGRDHPLTVEVLDLVHDVTLPGGRAYSALSYYAYWFVGKDRETHSHYQRMLWMGMDRIFRNVSHRWAYISVGGGRQDGSPAYQSEISQFVGQLYPHMLMN